jgi:hypothetical protein
VSHDKRDQMTSMSTVLPMRKYAREMPIAPEVIQSLG